MPVQVTINSIVGKSPYDIFICQSNGSGCFYITTITTTPYVFNIPPPYDTSSSYMLKIFDANKCEITSVESVNSTPMPTPTPTKTPTQTPTNTKTPTPTPTNLPLVTICDQIWTSKNLDVTTYRDGTTLIPQATTAVEWENYNASETGAWCYYNFNAANGPIYGKLYNWFAVDDSRGLAPTGYHIPADIEWLVLTNCLLGASVAGGKLKSTGTIQLGTGLWNTPNTNATNITGWTGLPGGSVNLYGGVDNTMGNYGTWWSSTENITPGIPNAWCFSLDYNVGNADRFAQNKKYGSSVRLLKD